MLKTNRNILLDRGFEQLSQGICGNAGQNLYVSRKGVLQRIHHYDYNKDGYIELPIANSHDDDTRVPVYVYGQPLSSSDRLELATDGAYAAAVGDLDGDGFDDLVIANQYDGVSNEVYAQIYYGSAVGYGPQRMLKLWAPSAKDVEIGNFNGDGRPDIVFISRNMLRLFEQNEQGFASGGYRDIELPYEPESLAAADYDGDGYADLAVRSTDRTITVYWGGPDGIDSNRCTVLDSKLSGQGTVGAGVDQAASGAGGGALEVLAVSSASRLKQVTLRGKPHLFVSTDGQSLFIPFTAARAAGVPVVLDSGEAVSAASGDIRGRGTADLVLAARQPGAEGKHISWIYWEVDGGYSNSHRLAVQTDYAIDVAVGDLDGDGCAEIVFCQDKTVEMYSHYSLIYRGTPAGIAADPIRLESHCAMDAFIARTSDASLPQVIIVNHLSNRILGNVPSYIYWGGPSGFDPARRLELPGWAATEIRACDFNDDGHVDLFVTNSNENALHMERGSYLYYGDGSEEGFSEANRIELPTVHNMSSCCADINRDGYLDLIVGGFANEELLIFFGSEGGFVQEPQRIRLEKDGIVFKQPRFMTLADFTGNGWLDLAIPECGPSGKLILLWGGPDGFDMSRSTLLDAGPSISTRAADLNGDGWLDLIVGGYKGDDPGDPYRTFAYIYWGGPQGFSNDRRTQLPANFAADITVADFNNDGVLDLFVSCYHGHRSRDLDSYLYWGEPGGVYTEYNRTALPHHSAAGSLAADFNEDGYVDLAVANHKTHGNHPGLSVVWWNGPAGFSPERVTKLPTTGPHGITHADIGNIMDRSDEEWYESRALEVPWASGISGVEWQAELPPKTWVRAQIRTAACKEALVDAAWVGPEGKGSWFSAAAGDTLECPLRGAWAQYRLALGAVNSGSTPRISQVMLIGVPAD